MFFLHRQAREPGGGRGDENKMLARRRFGEIWNGGNRACADELYVPNYMKSRSA